MKRDESGRLANDSKNRNLSVEEKVEKLKKKYSQELQEGKKIFREYSPTFIKGTERVDIPREIIYDKKVPHTGLRMFMVWWDLWKLNRRGNDAFTYVGLCTIVKQKAVCLSYNQGLRIVRKMEMAGWMTSISRKGMRKTNIIVLHEKKGMKISELEKEKYKKIVAKREKEWLEQMISFE